jgi:hypothetical protein
LVNVKDAQGNHQTDGKTISIRFYPKLNKLNRINYLTPKEHNQQCTIKKTNNATIRNIKVKHSVN